MRTAGTAEKKGQPLSEVTLRVRDHNAAVSDDGGHFSLAMAGMENGDPFYFQSVFKAGYELIDKDFLGNVHAFSSKVPVEIVLKSKLEIAKEREKIEEAAYQKASERYKERMAELEKALSEKTISEEIFRKKADRLQSDFESFESLISTMSDRYARTDYDNLDKADAEINMYISTGDLVKADSLINRKGSITGNALKLKDELADIEIAERQLKEAGRRLEERKVKAEKAKNSLKSDMYNKYSISLSRFDLDSADYYLKMRADFDTTDIRAQYDYAAFCRMYQADYDRSEEYLSRAADYVAEKFGTESPEMSDNYMYRGLVAENRNNHEAALDYYNKALAIRSAFFDEMSLKVYDCKFNIASVQLKKGNFKPAEELTMKYTGEQYDNVSILSINAVVLLNSGNYKEALNAIEKAEQSLLMNDMEDGGRMMTNVLSVKTSILGRMGDYEESLRTAERSLEIARRIFPEHHPDVALSLVNLGQGYESLRKTTEAEKCLLEALDIFTSLFGDENLQVATVYNNLGSVYSDIKDYQKAKECYERSLHINEKLLPEDSDELSISYNNLSVFYSKMGNHDAALEYMEKVLAIDEKRYDSNHPRIAHDLMNIASVKASLGDDSFKKDFHKALQIYIIRYGEDSKLLAEAYLQVAQAYLSVKQYEEAKDYFEKSYSIYSSDGLSMEDVLILSELAAYYEKIEVDYSKAIPYLMKAYGILDANMDADASQLLMYRYIVYIYHFELLSRLSESSPEYESVLSELEEFDKKMILTATIMDGTPASEMGLSGEYVAVYYNGWSILHVENLYDYIGQYKGKPKHVIFYRDGQFLELDFDDMIGAQFLYKKSSPEEKQRIIQEYRKYKGIS